MKVLFHVVFHLPAFASLLASGHSVTVSEEETRRLKLKPVNGILEEWKRMGLSDGFSRSLLQQMVINFNVQDYSRGELSFVGVWVCSECRSVGMLSMCAGVKSPVSLGSVGFDAMKLGKIR